METSTRRSYTKEQRAAAVADVPALGAMEAGKKHGIPQSCVSQWAKRAGVRRETTPAPSTPPTPKATARNAKAKAQPAPPPKTQPVDAPKRDEPVVASEPAPATPPSKRTLKARVAKIYTPSQKAAILELPTGARP